LASRPPVHDHGSCISPLSGLAFTTARGSKHT
jgi:hypothetical protein